MELDQFGYPSKKKFKITLSEKYHELYNEAKEQMRDLTWDLLADRARKFPFLVRQVSEVKLSKATSTDIGTLMRYFSFRNKIITEILKNMSWKEV